MAGSNKLNASRMCPIFDSGPPKGDVWVQVKKAVLPYHIEEMGTGPDGKAAILMAQRTQKEKDQNAIIERRESAIKAYTSGVGNLTDVLKQPDVDTNPHYSAKDMARQAALYPPEPPKTRAKYLWDAFKKACKDIWDSAQEN